MRENTNSSTDETILVTGFGPFTGHTRNTSEEVATSVDGRTIHGHGVIGRALETSWRRAWPALRSAAAELHPFALVILVVSFDAFVRCELTAANEVVPEQDIDGCWSPGGFGALVDGGPRHYESTLPLGALMQRSRWADEESSMESMDIRISADAGRFICNQVFYLARHHLGESMPHIGLIHLPPIVDWRGSDAERVVADGVRLVEDMVSLLAGGEAESVQTY